MDAAGREAKQYDVFDFKGVFKDAIAANRDLKGTALGDALIETAAAADEATVAADKVTRATSMKDARAARDRVKLEAKKAELAASKAKLEALKQPNRQDLRDIAQSARELADQTDRLSDAVDGRVKKAEATRRVWNDSAGRPAYGRVAVALATSMGTAAFLGLVATWVFVFGCGRKVVGDGPARFKAKALPFDKLNDKPEYVLDVVAELGIALVQAVHLVDPVSQKNTNQVKTADGTWDAVGLTIKYTPPSPRVKKASVQYVLEAVTAPNFPGVFSDPEPLSIAFWPKAKQIVVAAADRTSAVSFPGIPDGSELVNGAAATGWKVDTATKTAAYDRANLGAAAVASTDYRVGFKDYQSKLVVLFPIAPQTGPSPLQLPAAYPAQWKLEPFGVQDRQGFGFMPVDAVAVVILNCLPTPLRLVGMEPMGIGAQLHYPATVDPDNKSVSLPHEIPGVRPYPKPTLHQRPKGGPKLLGGVGMYQFDNSVAQGWDCNLAMRFSYKADGSGPYFGVGFRYNARSHDKTGAAIKPVSSVSVDIFDKYSNLSDFYYSTVDRLPRPPALLLSNDSDSEIAIWGSFETLCMPVKCPNTYTLTVWVRDAASSLGMG